MTPSFPTTKMCFGPPRLRWAPPAKVNLKHIIRPCRLWADHTRMKREHFEIEHKAIFLEYQLLQLKAHMPASLHRKKNLLKHCHFFTNQYPELANAPNSPPHTPLLSFKPYEPDYNMFIRPLYSPTYSGTPVYPSCKPHIPIPTCANGHILTDDGEYIWHSVFTRLSRDFQSVCLRLAELELEVALVELRLDIRNTNRRNNLGAFKGYQRAFRTTVFELMRVIYDAIAHCAQTLASKWRRTARDCCFVTLV